MTAKPGMGLTLNRTAWRALALSAGALTILSCGPDGGDRCEAGDTRDCTCGPFFGTQTCAADGLSWDPCSCWDRDAGVWPDGATPTDGAVRDGAVTPDGATPGDGAVDLDATPGPDADPNPSFCVGKMDGPWCDGDDLVDCENGAVATRETCANGCVSMPVGTADVCAAVPFCTTVPAMASPTAPTSGCNYMDWNMSPDGFTLISRFGTSNDSTTWGHTTTCGFLQGHYDYHACRYDVNGAGCLDTNDSIPWVQGNVDYDYQSVIDEVDQYAPATVPDPDIFYVACAQRFNCGAVLRVSNPQNGRCVVVYTEDGGPGVTYEGPSYGGRRILDSSPAVVRFLDIQSWGWASSTLVYVEWGLSGDTPGEACTPCQSSPAQAGSEASRTPWDPNHMQSGVDCR